jgi:hypothetical protein
MLLSPRDEKFSRVRVKFCTDIARCGDICTGKNNFQNLSRKWCARSGIEQKMSESVPGDSRRTSLAAEIFTRLRAPISFRVEIFCSCTLMRGK